MYHYIVNKCIHKYFLSLQPSIETELDVQHRSINEWCRAKLAATSPLDSIAVMVLRHMLKVTLSKSGTKCTILSVSIFFVTAGSP